MLLIVACFPDNAVSNPVILEVAKSGISDVAKVPVVIFPASNAGI